MFPEYSDFAPKLARIVTEFSAPIHGGEYVAIMGNTLGQPLIEALYAAVLARGGHPQVFMSIPALNELFDETATEAQLDYVPPTMYTIADTVDVRLGVSSPANTRAGANLDPVRSARRSQALRGALKRFWERYAEGTHRWNVCPWPSNAAAQDAEMSLRGYTEFVYKACALDQPDPVAYWASVRDQQLALLEWLQGKSTVEVRGPGIDLTYKFTGRRWQSAHGIVNLPDGELYSSPIEDTMQGHVEFSFPTFYGGREVNGVKLTFKDGVVTEASATKGEKYLLQMLDLDEGARRVGEFAIGTNMGIQRVTGSTLFDEKIGGTVHLALGKSYPECDGQNDSVLHWDMVHDMRAGGEIYVDGELFYRAGEFLVG